MNKSKLACNSYHLLKNKGQDEYKYRFYIVGLEIALLFKRILMLLCLSISHYNVPFLLCYGHIHIKSSLL